MNNHFHFNAFPEAAICVTELSSLTNMRIVIPLNTDSLRAHFVILKTQTDKILSFYYYIHYFPKAPSINNSFKFLSVDVPVNISGVELIRHKTVLIKSTTSVAENLSEVPFGNTHVQLNIPDAPSKANLIDTDFLSDSLNENPNNQKLDPLGVPFLYSDFLNSETKSVDSCTIPPGVS